MRLRSLATGVAYSLLLGMLCTRGCDANEQQRKSEMPMGRQHILSNQITISNLAVFEAQTLRDLPTGTSKKDVEAYLALWNIPHTFFGSDPIYGKDGNCFMLAFKNIGTVNIFTASLQVWIPLDENDKVRGIDFRVSYL